MISDFETTAGSRTIACGYCHAGALPLYEATAVRGETQLEDQAPDSDADAPPPLARVLDQVLTICRAPKVSVSLQMESTQKLCLPDISCNLGDNSAVSTRNIGLDADVRTAQLHQEHTEHAPVAGGTACRSAVWLSISCSVFTRARPPNVKLRLRTDECCAGAGAADGAGVRAAPALPVRAGPRAAAAPVHRCVGVKSRVRVVARTACSSSVCCCSCQVVLRLHCCRGTRFLQCRVFLRRR